MDMTTIRVTKIFNIEMAHALWNYNGACKNIHGHSYKLFVTLIGKPVENENDPKNGMVLDFVDLRTIVNSSIIEKYDHALVINKNAVNDNVKHFKQMFDKLIITDFQPTVENLLIHFSKILKNIFPPEINLYSLKLQETENAYAEWFNSDNLNELKKL